MSLEHTAAWLTEKVTLMPWYTHIYNILINIVMYIILHIVTIYFVVVYMLSLLCAFYVQADTEISCNGARIAQLVQHPTLEKGIILMWVSVPDAARDFSPRVNFQCRLSYGVRTAPAYSQMHQHLWAKNPKRWQPYHCLDPRKYCTR